MIKQIINETKNLSKFKVVNNFSFIIIVTFILTRLPYFLYGGIPFLNTDAYEYYNIIHLLDNQITHQIGFPGVGYPLILFIAEKIYDSLFFAIILQSSIHLLCVLFFYKVYIKHINQLNGFVAIVLGAYLASNSLIYYDTAFHPDSLMSSMFICFSALTLIFLKRYNLTTLTLISIVITYGISIRANAIILLPILLVLFILYYLKQRPNLKVTLASISCICAPFFFLSSFHFINPLYQTFNVISYPAASTTDNTPVKRIKTTSNVWEELIKTQPCDLLVEDLVGNGDWLSNKALTNYHMGYNRGYVLSFNEKNELIVTNKTDSESFWKELNIDSCLNNSNKKNELLHIKSQLTDSVTIVTIDNRSIHYKLANLIGYFKLFYLNSQNKHLSLGYENSNFYESNFKNRYWIINSHQKNSHSGYHVDMSKILKEFTDNDIIKKKEENYWKIKTSRLYRWLVKPIISFSNFFFRNSIVLTLFIIYSLYSLYNIFIKKDLSVYSLLPVIGFIVFMANNILHSFYLVFLYTRYTVQTNFFVYLSFIFLGLTIYKLYNNKYAPQ
jgi:hypothetical protein